MSLSSGLSPLLAFVREPLMLLPPPSSQSLPRFGPRYGSRSYEFPRPFSWQLPGSRGSFCAVQSLFSWPGVWDPWSSPLCGPDVLLVPLLRVLDDCELCVAPPCDDFVRPGAVPDLPCDPVDCCCAVACPG